MKRLILMRGIPGGGKSTRSRELAMIHIENGGRSVAILATDYYHMEGDKYIFKADLLGQYHEMNHAEAEAFMKRGIELVIIDNTNVRRRDMKPYIDSAKVLGYTVKEVIIGGDKLLPSLDKACPHKFADYIDLCAGRNTHDVPRDAIEKMARRFEE